VRAIPERLFVLVHDRAPTIDGQALGGNGRDHADRPLRVKRVRIEYWITWDTVFSLVIGQYLVGGVTE
jgi:hypothetical protein